MLTALLTFMIIWYKILDMQILDKIDQGLITKLTKVNPVLSCRHFVTDTIFNIQNI